jgi:hypothetical protein
VLVADAEASVSVDGHVLAYRGLARLNLLCTIHHFRAYGDRKGDLERRLSYLNCMLAIIADVRRNGSNGMYPVHSDPYPVDYT